MHGRCAAGGGDRCRRRAEERDGRGAQARARGPRDDHRPRRASTLSDLTTDDERHNRAFWDRDADAYQAAHGEALTDAPRAWGVWRIGDDDVHALGDVRGLDVLELGCGAAQWSVALARDGARVVGLDISLAQLSHARGTVPLVLASAEAVPLHDACFDVVFCDHGAMSFCPPERTVAEAARLLRPGGRLVFCKTTALVYLTWDAKRERQTRTLHNPYFGMRTFVFDEGTVDHQIPYGEWIRLFRCHGLVVEDLIELRPSERATTTYDDFIPRSWARAWPAEEIWVVAKPASDART